MYDVIRNWHIIATSIHCYALVLLKDLTSTFLCVMSFMVSC